MATEFFLSNDLPLSTTHKFYAEKLIKQLKERDEMILDFDALQSSVDPMLDTSLLPATSNGDNNEKFDYEEFLTSYFAGTTGTGILPSMQVFKLRGYARAGPKFPLMEGIRQLSSITELDLSQNDLSKEGIQLWSLVELKTLKLDSTNLQQVPPSIGRLRKLEYLSLSTNKLDTLPLTLGYCKNLTYLNLEKNKFRTLPGTVLLKLTNLQDLKRWDNNLEKRFDGYERFPHIKCTSVAKRSSNNPDCLQALTCRTIMTTDIDYWAQEGLPPLHCKILDSYATQYQYCENCHQAMCSQMFEIKILLLKYAGLIDLPISIHSCQNCKDVLVDKYKEKQGVLQEEMDADYEKAMTDALNSFEAGDINSSGLIHPRPRHTRRRRHNKKCSIM